MREKDAPKCQLRLRLIQGPFPVKIWVEVAAKHKTTDTILRSRSSESLFESDADFISLRFELDTLKDAITNDDSVVFGCYMRLISVSRW